MSDALEKGIAIANANLFGDPRRKVEAIEYFKQALRENPKEIQAWIGIANMAEDRATRKYCFQKVLELDPQNEFGKIMVEFFRDTEVKSKWIKEESSPLQPFFDGLERPQASFPGGLPPWLNQSNQPPLPTQRTTQPYRPTPPNFNSGAIPKKSPPPAPVRTQTKTKNKKKGMSPWVSSYLIFNILIGIVSIIAGLASNFLVPFFMAEAEPTLLENISLSIQLPIFFGLTVFLQLNIYLFWIYWAVAGYVGIYKLIKKGYLIEYLGCSLVLAGVPLILPFFLGPLIYSWADRIREKP
jgi:hypothetical protein